MTTFAALPGESLDAWHRRTRGLIRGEGTVNAENERLRARLQWIMNVTRNNRGADNALVQIWEGCRDELGLVACATSSISS